MKVNLFFSVPLLKRVSIELTNVPSEHDDNLQWPMRCTMTVTMFNQAGDDNHYVQTRDFEVGKGTHNSQIKIPCDTIELAPPGVKYLKDDSLTFRVDVSLR